LGRADQLPTHGCCRSRSATAHRVEAVGQPPDAPGRLRELRSSPIPPGGPVRARARRQPDVAPFHPAELVEAYLLSLGDDVTKTTRQLYYAFRRIKNFACVEIHPQTRQLLVYLKTDPSSITLEPGFTRDVTKIGHFGTGNLEVVIGRRSDLERAQPLILASYEAS
jgi:predicted transport protein